MQRGCFISRAQARAPPLAPRAVPRHTVLCSQPFWARQARCRGVGIPRCTPPPTHTLQDPRCPSQHTGVAPGGASEGDAALRRLALRVPPFVEEQVLFHGVDLEKLFDQLFGVGGGGGRLPVDERQGVRVSALPRVVGELPAAVRRVYCLVELAHRHPHGGVLLRVHVENERHVHLGAVGGDGGVVPPPRGVPRHFAVKVCDQVVALCRHRAGEDPPETLLPLRDLVRVLEVGHSEA
mmetsp:Transcript_23572/g.59667  ORF Transcript_23572/g.59667 Transcript_23572/m.59667 type:complete len:237 (+) Transcript_23572:16-726(+)